MAIVSEKQRAEGGAPSGSAGAPEKQVTEGLGDFLKSEAARGDAYRFLAACFYVPDVRLFKEERVLENLSASLESFGGEAAGFSREMEKSFGGHSEEALNVEYARLFVGPFELVAPPYGSVYLDGNRRVMGDSTLSVRQLYEEAGLTLDQAFKQPPDHIAAELEFMYYLIYRECEALRQNDREQAMSFISIQRRFNDTFLLKWVPAFAGNIREGTTSGYFLALANCLNAFVAACRVPAEVP